ncbi:hypothetical protein VP1G_11339 [Cytospora mali]|uniref:Uncharacterized protein n=1 Tax=Cytospora mali TaxID=578113 RepID=A0A194VBV5_CYTMA|nr:hypothetical protein VP1G_11339 [Valsa mali var. pyri (nom. inval.)]
MSLEDACAAPSGFGGSLVLSSCIWIGAATPTGLIPGSDLASIESRVSDTNLNVKGLRLMSSEATSLFVGAQTNVSGFCAKERLYGSGRVDPVHRGTRGTRGTWGFGDRGGSFNDRLREAGAEVGHAVVSAVGRWVKTPGIHAGAVEGEDVVVVGQVGRGGESGVQTPRLARGWEELRDVIAVCRLSLDDGRARRRVGNGAVVDDFLATIYLCGRGETTGVMERHGWIEERIIKIPIDESRSVTWSTVGHFRQRRRDG